MSVADLKLMYSDSGHSLLSFFVVMASGDSMNREKTCIVCSPAVTCALMLPSASIRAGIGERICSTSVPASITRPKVTSRALPLTDRVISVFMVTGTPSLNKRNTSRPRLSLAFFCVTSDLLEKISCPFLRSTTRLLPSISKETMATFRGIAS